MVAVWGETEIGGGNAAVPEDDDVEVGGGGVGLVAKLEGCEVETEVGGGIDNDEELKHGNKNNIFYKNFKLSFKLFYLGGHMECLGGPP